MGPQSDWLGDAGRSERGETLTGSVVLAGVVDDVVFTSARGDYVVARLVVEGRDAPVTAVGDLGEVTPGQPLRLTGKFVRHPRYGMRFAASAAVPMLPESGAGLYRYLASGAIYGVGEKTARKIVDKLGPHALDRIAEDPDALKGIVGRKRAGPIRAQVREKRVEMEVLSVLFAHGIGTRLARRIHKRYGEAAIVVVRQEPYRLAVEVDGVGFKRADAIARAAGIGEDDPARAAAAVMHVLREAAADGHVLLPVAEIGTRVAALRVPTEHVAAAVEALSQLEYLAVEDEAVYLRPLYQAEVALADRLRALARTRAPDAAALARADRASHGLAERQREAVRATLEGGLVVLTGGPGTGKTTTLRAVVALHEGLEHRVALAAPTGRAAKRIAETTRREARTLHRLLEWLPAGGGFGRGPDNPLDIDLLVVDEASMLDLPLAQRLFSAVPDEATVLLVGDVDQLPPVGPGGVLRDVIASRKARTVQLTEVFRQAQESGVVRNAHRVNQGALPVAGPPDGDFHVVGTKDPERAAELVVTAVADRIPQAFGLDPRRDVMVLSPMHKGPLGVAALNRMLQARLNAGEGPSGTLRAGDKVMQLRNDYERDIYNGDLGFVKKTSPGAALVDFDGREVAIEGDALDELALAYASTIHKAQGSEFPAVVIALGTGHHVMLARNLLYTAITRARKLVVLVAHPAAMRRAVENVRSSERHGRLRERLVAS